MITPYVLNTAKTATEIVVDIEYRDEAGKAVAARQYKTDRGNIEPIKQQVIRHAADLQKIADTALPAVGVAFDTKIEATPVPDEFTVWQRNFYRLERVQRLVELGVLTGSEVPVVALRNKVKADFKPAYIDAIV